jgi:hypothetical protein
LTGIIFGQYFLLPLYEHCAKHVVVQHHSSKIRIENASEFFFVKALDHGRGRQNGDQLESTANPAHPAALNCPA